jgi:hypothetical protein
MPVIPGLVREDIIWKMGMLPYFPYYMSESSSRGVHELTDIM